MAALRRASFARTEGERVAAQTDARRALIAMDRLHGDLRETHEQVREAQALNRKTRLVVVPDAA